MGGPMSDPKGSFKGTTHDTHGAGTLKGTFLADDSKWATLRDRLFVVVALAAIVMMVITSVLTIKTSAAVDKVNRQQLAFVTAQNVQQLCAQRDIVQAVRSIGLKLGLPVEDIVPPDVSGLNCP
jgi:hypothetical protein